MSEKQVREAALEEGLQLIKNGMSIRKAAEAVGVSFRTLAYRHKNGKISLLKYSHLFVC